MEEKPVLEVHFSMDYDVFLRFSRFFAASKSKGYKNYPYVVIGISLVLIVLGILAIVMPWYTGANIVPLVLILILAAFLAIFLYLYYVMPPKTYEKNRNVLEGDTTFLFGEDELTIKTNSENATGENTLGYDAFGKIYELDNTFYMQLRNKQTYVLDKNQMTGQDTADLSEFLKGKFGKNYKRIEVD